jgi:valyl-tRNA synthetase
VEKRIRKDYPDGIPAVGADALRFTFAALATYGRTINFDLKRADGYKNFCNKLWNAARFVLMNSGFEIGDSGFGEATAQPAERMDADGASAPGEHHPHPNPPLEGEGFRAVTDAEKWILARLQRTLEEVERQMPLYRFDLVAQALYEFTWNEFCDWFVELAKPALSRDEGPALSRVEGPALNGADAGAAASTRHTLLHVLEALLRALHPIIPFITEEIWHEVAPRLGALRGDAKAFDAASISTRPYPRADQFPADGAAEAEVEWLRAVLTQVRRIRSEMNIPPTRSIPLLFSGGDAGDRARTGRFAAQIEFLARTVSQRWLDPAEAEPAAAAAIVGELRVLIPLAGLIDVAAEKARLARESKRIEGEIARCNAKLGNAKFVDNAPADVVEQEKQRLQEFQAMLKALNEQSGRLSQL